MSNNISPDKPASVALMNQLIETAETYGWSESIGFEFIIWEQLGTEDTRLPVETIEQIKDKSAVAGGWWTWPKGVHSEGHFVSMTEWDAVRASRNLP